MNTIVTSNSIVLRLFAQVERESNYFKHNVKCWVFSYPVHCLGWGEENTQNSELQTCSLGLEKSSSYRLHWSCPALLSVWASWSQPTNREAGHLDCAEGETPRECVFQCRRYLLWLQGNHFSSVIRMILAIVAENCNLNWLKNEELYYLT